MNTDVTKCARCSGTRGAHYGFCFVAQLWERVLGPGYPWMPPADVEEIPPPAEPPDEGDWDWAADLDVFRVERQEALANAGAGPTTDGSDEPDPQGVMEDFLVGAGHLESDAQWMPNHTDLHSEMVTKLPDGYLDAKVEEARPKRADQAERLKAMSAERHARDRREREDAIVQFLYDETETVTGARVRVSDVHDRYVAWAEENGRPYMQRIKLQELVGQLGYGIEKAYMPGTDQRGAPPSLVTGMRLKGARVDTAPAATFAEPAVPERVTIVGDRPGTELSKEMRDVVIPLVRDGWEYHRPTRGATRPRITSPQGKTVMLDAKPHGNGLRNVRSALKRAGAKL